MISAHHVFKTIGKKRKVILLSLYMVLTFFEKTASVCFITMGLKINHETSFSTSKLCLTKKCFIATSSIIQM